MKVINELEDILKCPNTQQNLHWLSDFELASLNQQISKQKIVQLNGRPYDVQLKAALRTSDQKWFYPVIEEICYLLPALALQSQVSEQIASAMPIDAKTQVKNFYDTIGWSQKEGIYQDAKDSEDLRPVTRQYILNCHLRLKKHLPKQGKFLLDIASGPVQYAAYLRYSENFDYRICADISLTALQEARKKLGEKGIYILCDITQLPIKCNTIDAVISLHTLYHVPAHEQLKAFLQLQDVLKPGGKSVIVYSWGSHSLLMNFCLLPFKMYSLVKRKLTSNSQVSSLYFYAHDYQWFKRELHQKYATQLYSWRSVNVPFLKIFIHSWLGGRQILQGIFWLENHFHLLLGRFGAYPLFVSVKK